MSEENNVDTRPQDVKDMQQALEDIHGYRNAVLAGSFPGRNSGDVTKLLGFLNETFKQIEAQFRATPYIQDLIAKAQAEQAAAEASAQSPEAKVEAPVENVNAVIT